MIKLYGPLTSRVLMCAWALDELGVAYENVPLNPHAGETRTPEYLAINPLGKVPALVDGEVKIFESLAITLYLAREYGMGKLMPADRAGQAQVLQWCFFAATEVEQPLVTLFGQQLFTPPEARKQDRIDEANGKLPKLLTAVSEHLSRQPWLVGTQFSVADLALTSVMFPAMQMLKMDLSKYPDLQRWLGACKARPAFAQFQKQMDAAAERFRSMPPGAPPGPPR